MKTSLLYSKDYYNPFALKTITKQCVIELLSFYDIFILKGLILSLLQKTFQTRWTKMILKFYLLMMNLIF